MMLQQGAHLGELREDQSTIAFRQHFFEHFPESRQLARASLQTAAVGQVMRGMIADLLEPGQRGENFPFPFDTFRAIDVLQALSAPRPRTVSPALE